jgi:signal-transduction protein with cAMP-binding, CBS, and nucleotidyltransferase domain
VERAAALMAEKHIHRVFVNEGGELLGVISTKDVMAAICDKRIETPLSRFASSPLHSVQVDDPMSLALQNLESACVRGLIVTENGWPVGIFSQTEALAARDFPPGTEVSWTKTQHCTEHVHRPQHCVFDAWLPCATVWLPEFLLGPTLLELLRKQFTSQASD